LKKLTAPYFFEILPEGGQLAGISLMSNAQNIYHTNFDDIGTKIDGKNS
jgi:hypothetical protein